MKSGLVTSRAPRVWILFMRSTSLSSALIALLLLLLLCPILPQRRQLITPRTSPERTQSYPELIPEHVQRQLGILDQARAARSSQWNSGDRLQNLQDLSPAVLVRAHPTCPASRETGVDAVWKCIRPYASQIEERGGDQTYAIFRPRGFSWAHLSVSCPALICLKLVKPIHLVCVSC
jgi:hypothetical protein